MSIDIVKIFWETFEKGGVAIVGCIFFVSVVSWYIGLGRFVFLYQAEAARKKYLKSLRRAIRGKDSPPTGVHAYDRLMREMMKRSGDRTRLEKSITSIFREFLVSFVPELERGFSTMSAWISTAPLLGLLGTVMGMIRTFEVITTFGVGNPSLTAEGISVALITTQAGLTVAFPAMLLHNYLANRRTAFVGRLLKDGEDLVNLVKQNQRPATGSEGA